MTSAFNPGDIIANKYRVESLLGAGGMGVVLCATHLGLERRVAVKIMRPELREHPEAVERLLLEAKSAAKIDSQHVCKVLDVATLPDGTPYIVMEHLEGCDLATLIERVGKLDATTTVDYVLQACEALAEAHAANIVHRDLKPENLFLANRTDGTAIVKVLDFGISKQIGDAARSRALTNPTASVGSPQYMAPEQMISSEGIDVRVDIWALGAIVFELLTGRQAFEGDTLPAVCAAVMNTNPPRIDSLVPEVPAELSDAVERCLNKKREQRYRDIAALAPALAPFGSAKAATSVRRIERILAGSASTMLGADTGVDTAGDADQAATAKDGERASDARPPGQVVRKTEPMPSDGDALLPKTEANRLETPMTPSAATTAGTASTVGVEPQKKPWLWAAALIALATASGIAMFVGSESADGAASQSILEDAESAGVPDQTDSPQDSPQKPAPLVVPATDVAAEPTPSSDPQSDRAAATETATTAPANTAAATDTTATRTAATRNTNASPSQAAGAASVKPGSASATPRPGGGKTTRGSSPQTAPTTKGRSTDKPAASPSDAWDPSSFGTRR